MSVTELRDEQANEWHAWAERNRDDALEHNRRRRDELAAETSGKKVRLCEFVSDEGMPCLRKHHARGMCNAHFLQHRRGEHLRPIWKPAIGCEVAGCAGSHYARRYCKSHWRQLLRGVTPHPHPRIGLNAAPPGSRNGEPWSEWEFDLAMSDTPLREVALRLGRTYSSVVRARQRRRKMLGLGIEYMKSEKDPYDGSDRRGVLYTKDET